MGQTRLTSLAFVILSYVLLIMYGCDDATPAAAPTPTPLLQASNSDPRAEQIIRQAVAALSNLRSYRFVYVRGRDKSTAVVIPPDRCRITLGPNWDVAETDIIRIGKQVYVPARGSDYGSFFEYEHQLPEKPDCLRDFLAHFAEDVSRLDVASIFGYEDLDGRNVIHIRYRYFVPPFPGPDDSTSGGAGTADVWIEEQTSWVRKAVPGVVAPELYYLYSHFNEPVIPPIERPANVVIPVPTVPLPALTSEPLLPAPVETMLPQPTQQPTPPDPVPIGTPYSP